MTAIYLLNNALANYLAQRTVSLFAILQIWRTLMALGFYLIK